METFRPVLILIFICFATSAEAQHDNTGSTLYIEVLIDSKGRIYAQNDRIQKSMISAWIKNYLDSQPALRYDQVAYRIYGDKSNTSGAISDVVDKLIQGYDYQILVQKYLLDTQELNLDGKNYIQKLNELDWELIE